MKIDNKFRIIFYILVLALLGSFAQWKKADINSKKERVSVSIPNQIAEFGQAIDIEVVKEDKLLKLHRLTVEAESKEKGKAVFYLSQNELENVKSGQLVLHPLSGEEIGKIQFVSGTADLNTGLFVGIVQFLKGKGTSESRSVDIVVRSLKNSFSVPIEAVDQTSEENKALVWILDEQGRVNTRAVSLGLFTHTRVEIKNGLVAGEKVVVNGYKYLRPDQKARVRNCSNCLANNEEVAK